MPALRLTAIDAVSQSRMQPLRLKRLDVIPVSMPLSRPMKMSNAVVRCADNLMVRAETADGVVGWGEAASAPAMTGETLAGMTSVAALLADAITGVDLRFRAAVVRRLAQLVHGNSGARSAIEMALLDAVGRALSINAVELLGGRCHDTITPMWLIGNDSVDADVAEAHDRRAAGYVFFKLKVGAKALADDIAAVHAVRAALGPDVTVCADANGGFTEAGAERLMRETRDAGLLFLEQPLPAGAVAASARLQAMNLLALGADEGIHTVADIERHAACDAVRGVSLKLIKLGGPTATVKAAGRAADLGLAVNIAAKVAESSIASAATAHVACAVGEAAWGISLTNVYLEDDPVVRPLSVEDGVMRVPDGPGLGIEVDESAVHRYQTPRP